MLEQTCVPFRGERLPREIPVAPVKNVRTRVIYLKAKRNSDALPKCDKATDSSETDLLPTSVGYNIKSALAELEKRRAKLFALARSAEAEAREAKEKCEQAENRLEREMNQRLVAERRLRKIEEDRLRLLQTVEIEGEKTIKAVLAQAKIKAKLKEAEGRIKDAENDAKSLTLALGEADQKRAEAEASARVAEENAHKIEALVLGEEAVAPEATEKHLLFGLLIFANGRASARRFGNPRRLMPERQSRLRIPRKLLRLLGEFFRRLRHWLSGKKGL